MCGDTEDVVVMTEVKALAVLLSVIDHGYSGYVIHHLPGLRVEKIIPAVAAPVPAHERERENKVYKTINKKVLKHFRTCC